MLNTFIAPDVCIAMGSEALRLGHGAHHKASYETTRQPDGGKGFPLRMAGEGDWVRIVGFSGGAGFHDRMAGLGLAQGVVVQVVRNPMDGKLVIGFKGTRLFIGGGMAHKISVVVMEGDLR